MIMLTLCSHISTHNVCRGRQHSGTRYPKVFFFTSVSFLFSVDWSLFFFIRSNFLLKCHLLYGKQVLAQVISSSLHPCHRMFFYLLKFCEFSILVHLVNIRNVQICMAWCLMYGCLVGSWFMVSGITPGNYNTYVCFYFKFLFVFYLSDLYLITSFSSSCSLCTKFCSAFALKSYKYTVLLELFFTFSTYAFRCLEHLWDHYSDVRIIFYVSNVHSDSVIKSD